MEISKGSTCYDSIQVKQIFIYLELADLPKIINSKLDQGEDRLAFSQVLIYIQKYMVSKPFKKKYYDSAVTALSLYQRQRI